MATFVMLTRLTPETVTRRGRRCRGSAELIP